MRFGHRTVQRMNWNNMFVGDSHLEYGRKSNGHLDVYICFTMILKM